MSNLSRHSTRVLRITEHGPPATGKTTRLIETANLFALAGADVVFECYEMTEATVRRKGLLPGVRFREVDAAKGADVEEVVIVTTRLPCLE